jgi:hypothetical protein
LATAPHAAAFACRARWRRLLSADGAIRSVSLEKRNRERAMQYVSTRGQAAALGFSDVLLAGLARDGGLYVPETWPRLAPAVIAGFAGKPYAGVAFEVIRPFVGGEIADADLRAI